MKYITAKIEEMKDQWNTVNIGYEMEDPMKCLLTNQL